MQRFRYTCVLGLFACGVLAVAPVRAERVAAVRRASPVTEVDVVAAVNVLSSADIGIASAARTGCMLERLPGSRAALLSLVPGDHRELLEECARGRMRVAHRARDFDLLALIDEPAERPAAVAAVRGFFAERTVDVARGRGLSDGPYPISFDWVVVLDPQSKTMMSFVLNCRD